MEPPVLQTRSREQLQDIKALTMGPKKREGYWKKKINKFYEVTAI